MFGAHHFLSDLASCIISIIALFVSRIATSTVLSFHCSHTEVFGAFIYIFFIWALTEVLTVFALIHLFNVTTVNSSSMIIMGLICFAFNILLTFFLGHQHHGHSNSHSDYNCHHGAHEHGNFHGHEHEINEHEQ